MNGRTNSNGVGTDTLQVPLDPPENLTATAGNAKVSLTWVDPVDKYATPEGETAQDPQQLVSEWDYTVVVRKVGSQPNDPNDGTVVTKSSIRNQYQTSPYEDTGLINDTVYFYGVFAVNKDGVASDGCISDSVTPKAGVPVSTLSTGTIIKINENGAPVEYLIVHQGLPSSMYDESCNGCWVLRKNISENIKQDTANYKASNIYTYLSTNWYTRYNTSTLSQIKQIKIPYQDGQYPSSPIQSGTNGLSCKFFLLGAYEVGYSDSSSYDFSRDGAKLDYFKLGTNGDSTRIANYNNEPSNWWTRSVNNDTYNAMEVCYISDNGYWYSSSLTNSNTNTKGLRTAFIISSDSIIDINMNLVSN